MPKFCRENSLFKINQQIHFETLAVFYTIRHKNLVILTQFFLLYPQ